MGDTAWARYVRRTSDGATGSEIEQRTGIAQSTVSRWFTGGRMPMPAHAAKFAQSYGGNVLEAFVAAGFLTEEEAGVPPPPEIDFYALVDDDPDLSAQAKIHLKNQYGLLKAASAHTESAAARELIENDDELDARTKARLLARLSNTTVGVAYTSSATVVEHPFPEIAAHVRKRDPRPDVVISDDATDIPPEVRAYVSARFLASHSIPSAARALNDRLAQHGRVDEALAAQASNVIQAFTGSGKTMTFLAAVGGQIPDLELTDDDRRFLAEVEAGAADWERPKAARTMQSSGRSLRRQQDEEAEASQDGRE
jgi:transcriptional regulator with XRE-family HTH domain